MSTAEPLLVAKGPGSREIDLLRPLANRHGLVAGATGTGKTITLRVLAEAFSRIGVPSFLADVKGDLSGLARPGGDSDKVLARAKELGIDFVPEAAPVGTATCRPPASARSSVDCYRSRLRAPTGSSASPRSTSPEASHRPRARARPAWRTRPAERGGAGHRHARQGRPERRARRRHAAGPRDHARHPRVDVRWEAPLTLAVTR